MVSAGLSGNDEPPYLIVLENLETVDLSRGQPQRSDLLSDGAWSRRTLGGSTRNRDRQSEEGRRQHRKGEECEERNEKRVEKRKKR